MFWLLWLIILLAIILSTFISILIFSILAYLVIDSIAKGLQEYSISEFIDYLTRKNNEFEYNDSFV